MPTLIYSMSVSLDGYIAGPDGAIDWAAPDEELMRFHNEQIREVTGHLCGRGLYEDMLGWETAEQTRTDPLELEFARVWKAIPKVVFSASLRTVAGNARLARHGVADELAAGVGQLMADGRAGLGHPPTAPRREGSARRGGG